MLKKEKKENVFSIDEMNVCLNIQYMTCIVQVKSLETINH